MTPVYVYNVVVSFITQKKKKKMWIIFPNYTLSSEAYTT